MKIARSFATAAVLGVVLAGAAPVANAAPELTTEAACAKQEQQVTRAKAALAKVTAVFANQKDHLVEAKAELAAATTDKERAKAARKVAHWEAKVADAKFDKKAQKMRLAKAEKRLADCLAQIPAP